MANNTPRTTDPLGRYYTNAHIGELLVKTLELVEPTVVVDLGAGDGALVAQAAEVWTEARFVTVDIDQRAASSFFPSFLGPAFEHHICDALEDSLPNRLEHFWGSADVALCNPPYIRPKWKPHFHEILRQAGLSGVVPHRIGAPAEALFIAQNLRLLKTGGKLGLIVPDTIISGEKFSPLRRALAEQHGIKKVIELPRSIFRNTDAKAHILILEKGSTTGNTISVQRVEADGLLSPAIDMPLNSASLRLDYSFLSQSSPTTAQSMTIGRALVFLKRGCHSSAERHFCDFPVFHTTDFAADSRYVPEDFTMTCRTAKKSGGTVAEPGDILLARVGRNLSTKVVMLKSGYVVVSDCVFVLRIAAEFRMRVFDFLTSKRGALSLESGTRGVSAKFLTTQSVEGMTFNF
jgi:type I restriction enzyme M protein